LEVHAELLLRVSVPAVQYARRKTFKTFFQILIAYR